MPTLQYDNCAIAYQVRYSNRKTLAISVYPDQRVIVKAPTGLSQGSIAAIVQRRAQWILRKQHLFANAPPPPLPRQYCQGEAHAFLGHTYPLMLTQGYPEIVHLQDDQLQLTSRDPNDQMRVKKQLQHWYRSQAHIIFRQRLQQCYNEAQTLNIPFPQLEIRKMKRRWGSCSSTGKILLNTALIKTPIDCIDYVITHELCHFIEFNHSPTFYQLLTSIMPDWKHRKNALNQLGALEE